MKKNHLQDKAACCFLAGWWTMITLWTAMLTGCTAPIIKDIELPTPAPLSRVTINLTAAGETDDPESRLHTLRLYAFQNFDNKTRLLGYAYRKSADENTGLDLSGNDKIEFILPNDTTLFIAIANEGNRTFRLDGVTEFPTADLGKADENSVTWSTDETTGQLNSNLPELRQKVTYTELRQLTFSELPESTIENGVEKKPLIPMACELIARTFSTSINLQLKRSVAKLDLYFSKVGRSTDKLFMGRGLYLYNQPPYGYLLPKENNNLTFGETAFNYIETTPDPPTNTQPESELIPQQCGGRELLKAAENLGQHDEQGVDINEITEFFNNPDQGASDQRYQRMPLQSFYLFANPLTCTVTSHEKPFPPANEYKQGGYYLKVLSHAHGIGDDGIEELLPGKTFYLSMKEVKANQHITIKSRIVMKGFLELQPDWNIEEWNYHKIEVPPFN